MEKREILTENQMRDWFKEHGTEIGKGFEEIFGSDDIENDNATEEYAFTTEGGIMFIRLKEVWQDVFSYTAQFKTATRYMVIPIQQSM